MTPELHISFEWDVDKERINIARHKLNFSEASHVFSDIFQLNLFDDEHSVEEDRWVVIGEIPNMKIVVVVHTVRQSRCNNDVTVRIISARKATKNERTNYFSRKT